MLFTSNTFATIDAHDRVFLVVKDIQSGEFFVEGAPIIGCYGLIKGPQLIQFTMEYKVTSNIGCGGATFHDNINYLTCASIKSYKETDDYLSFSEITLDISKCEDKDDPKLVSTIETAVKLNFPLKEGEVKLNLLK